MPRFSALQLHLNERRFPALVAARPRFSRAVVLTWMTNWLVGATLTTGASTARAEPDAPATLRRGQSSVVEVLPLPTYEMTSRFSAEPASKRGLAIGSMVIRGWMSLGASARRCLYVPYNDDRYEFDPIRDFELVPRKYARPERRRGQTTVNLRTPGMVATWLSPHVLEVLGTLPTAETMNGTSAGNAIQLDFVSQLPRWPDADDDEWVFSDFHPQALSTCPVDPTDSRTFTLIPSVRITANLTADRPPNQPLDQAPWTLVTPAVARESAEQPGQKGAVALTARKVVVALLRGLTRQRQRVGGTEVELWYRSLDPKHVLETVANALAVQSDMFGPLPFPRLVVLETSDVEKSSLPGMITVDSPKQAGMSELQGDILNWTDWQLSGFVAEQWFGASVTVRSLDDLWLLRGFVDFGTIEALSHSRGRFALLNHDHDGTNGANGSGSLNFDYRQAQDLIAALLTYLHPYNALTDEHYVTLERFTKQHSLGYMRHALSLRQINWTLGRRRFRSVLRQFVSRYQGRTVAPLDFLRTVDDHAERQAVARYLKQWWTSDFWPDFALLAVDELERAPQLGASPPPEVGGEDSLMAEAPDGEHHWYRVRIGENNGFALPVTVALRTDLGTSHLAKARPDESGRTWVADFYVRGAPETVEVEPSRQIFDWDRFDNTSAWPSFNFLPGNAKTFADDAYTVLWLPLATQLPGEPLTLQLVAQSLRYMHDSITAIGTYQPKTHVRGYSVYYLTDFPKYGTYLLADAIQDKGLGYSGERVIEAGAYKTVSWVKNPYLEYGLRLRNRTLITDPRSDHQTLALKGLIEPLNQYGPCNYSGKLEEEHTIHAVVDDYRYTRRFIEADGSCKVAKYLELGWRSFAGELVRQGRTGFDGGNFRFHPQDINEARLRFDDPSLDRVDRIATIGADVLLPAALPLPSSFYVLNRETRYRLFYDYGRSQEPNLTYKDAGVGLWVPMGIDLVGKGSVSLLNFSALVVLYREAGDFHSRTPGLLFDFDFLGKI